jgi:hypothetical protein
MLGYIVSGVFTCDPDPCGEDLAACCMWDGSCYVTTYTDCVDSSACMWLVDYETCDPNPCYQHLDTCCMPDGSCHLDCVIDCELSGGTIIYNGFDGCDPNPCPPPEAACCPADGNCFIATYEDCIAGGGCGWIEEYDSCDPNPCPPLIYDVCCLPDNTCVTECPVQCELLGGMVMEGEEECYPGICGESPAEKPSWGHIKGLYK